MRRARRAVPGALAVAISVVGLVAVAAGDRAVGAAGGDPPDAILAFGLPHVALGDARVAVSGDALVVRGLGASGSDGVRIELGDADGWAADVDIGPAGAVPVNARVRLDSTCTIEGVVRSVTVRFTGDRDGRVHLVLDDAGCACDVTAVFLLAGTEVSERPLDPSSPALVATGALGTVGDAPMRWRADRGRDSAGVVTRAFAVSLPEATELEMPDGTTIVADAIRIMVADAAGGPTADHDVRLTGSGLPAITLRDAVLTQFGHDVRSLLDGAMRGALDGRGGADLVLSPADPASGLDARLEPSMLPVREISAIDMDVVMEATGFFGGTQRTTLARFEDGAMGPVGTTWSFVGSCGCAYAFYADEPPWPTQAQRIVTAWSGGAEVASFASNGGPLWSVGLDGFPTTTSVELVPAGGDPNAVTVRTTWRFDQPRLVSFFSGGVPSLTVDEVRVTVRSAELPAEGRPTTLTGTEISLAFGAAGLPYRIQSVATHADVAACPADVSEDGMVSLVDLLAVLDGWGPCAACPADVDGDGAVGFLDLLAVIGSWGPCVG